MEEEKDGEEEECLDLNSGEYDEAAECIVNTERVIIHVDLDAFYAQVEEHRHPELAGRPIAVQQWNSLIAVGYSARAAGVSRFLKPAEAQKLCPDIACVHVDVVDHKVSLEAYREASRQIFPIFHRFGVCEKGGLDEAYIDVTERIKTTEFLSETAEKEFNSTHVVGEETRVGAGWKPGCEADAMLLAGARVAAAMRRAVFEELGYTCSAGIAHNKLLAKIASAKHKPAQQTLVPSLAAAAMLLTHPLRKIPLLGGKLGSALEVQLGQPGNGRNHRKESKVVPLLAGAVLSIPVPLLEEAVGKDQARWLRAYVRGRDLRSVKEKGPPRSLAENKSINPPLRTLGAVQEWLHTLAAAVARRVLDDSSRHHRWPKGLVLICRMRGRKIFSRSCVMPSQHGAKATAAGLAAGLATAHDAGGLVGAGGAQDSEKCNGGGLASGGRASPNPHHDTADVLTANLTQAALKTFKKVLEEAATPAAFSIGHLGLSASYEATNPDRSDGMRSIMAGFLKRGEKAHQIKGREGDGLAQGEREVEGRQGQGAGSASRMEAREPSEYTGAVDDADCVDMVEADDADMAEWQRPLLEDEGEEEEGKQQEGGDENDEALHDDNNNDKDNMVERVLPTQGAMALTFNGGQYKTTVAASTVPPSSLDRKPTTTKPAAKPTLLDAWRATALQSQQQDDNKVDSNTARSAKDVRVAPALVPPRQPQPRDDVAASTVSAAPLSELVPCPVCGTLLDVTSADQHVNRHFDGSLAAAMASKSALDSRPAIAAGARSKIDTKKAAASASLKRAAPDSNELTRYFIKKTK